MRCCRFGVTMLGLVAVALSACAPLGQRPPLDVPPSPLVYEDEATHTLFYVETDRRHVSAMRNGKLLWTRNMDETVNNARREPLGRITSIRSMASGQWPGWLGITFNTGEFGQFKMSNGDFIDEGCD